MSGSPTTDDTRVMVGARLAPSGVAWIDQWAELAGCDRSEMIRRMLAYAAEHMPAPRPARPAPKPTPKGKR
jgi:hypothetical protein